MKAISKVRRKAEKTSGLLKAARLAPTPLANAPESKAAKGARIKSAAYAMTMPMSNRRRQTPIDREIFPGRGVAVFTSAEDRAIVVIPHDPFAHVFAANPQAKPW